MNGGKIQGGNPENGRVSLDYYATNPKDVEDILKMFYRHNISFPGNKFLEPCAGGGHIVEACKTSTYMPKDQQWTTIDIMDRGYPLTYREDFLLHHFTERFDGIITNPPFQYASEFIEKCISILSDNGLLAMFLKIQFLESEDRRDLFNQYPPKFVYVLRKRTSTWNGGKAINPENGRPWAGVITYCWYVWQKGCTSEPIIRWVDDVDTTSKVKRLF